MQAHRDTRPATHPVRDLVVALGERWWSATLQGRKRFEVRRQWVKERAQGQAAPPRGERFTAISAGAAHTCGLRVDGSAVCWGNNEHGQAEPPPGRPRPALTLAEQGVGAGDTGVGASE